MTSEVAILTGGRDRPYALGLAAGLLAAGIDFDFIGSDELESPELRRNPRVKVFNLRGDTRPEASIPGKVLRIARYYLKLVAYAFRADPKVFHILWNNRIEGLDRTLLPVLYKLLGKGLVMTVHNVNILDRDGNDSAWNRWTLKFQYRLADHLFVHTQRMQRQLEDDFEVPRGKISVIPFGVNSTVPDTSLTPAQARTRLGLSPADQVMLFFGNIAPYKGVEHLVEALASAAARLPRLRLVIAGRPKGAESYWASIEARVVSLGLDDRVLRRIGFVPDAETEVFFKAADLLVLPYLSVFQSGVLFLGYNFGVPALATDVGSLAEDIVEGQTGFCCRPADPLSLAAGIESYFASRLFAELAARRGAIRSHALTNYSWATVAEITKGVYRDVTRN